MSEHDLNGVKVLNTGQQATANYVWSNTTLDWIPQSATVAGPIGDVNVTNSSIPVTVLTMPSTPVTGNFWQTTQPVSVSGTITVSDNHTTAAAPLSVRLTNGTSFYDAGTATSYLATAAKGATTAGNVTSEATDSNIQALHTKVINSSLAVTGAFYQATQPVSLASMPTTPVTGTFWQATQPVSIAGTVTTSDNHTTAGSPLSVRLSDGAAFYSALSALSGNLSTAGKGTTVGGQPTSENTNVNTQSLHTKITNTSIAVTGAFYQGTQPVSLASVPSHPVTGTFWQATQPVSVASMPSTPVTGTFWQATQPVSVAATVTTSDNHTTAAAPISVRLTDGAAFYNASGGGGGGDISTAAKGSTAAGNVTSENTNANVQSLHTTITNTVPVTGAFYQATQPVSGTFWQTTQPVSLESVPTHGVTGTFWQATQPVSIATAPVLVAGSAIIGKTGMDLTTPGTTNGVSISHIGATAVVTGGLNGSLGVGGTAAAGASASGNPIRNGGVARTANPTAVTDGQISNLMTDKMGRQVVIQGHIRDLVVRQSTTITSSVAATTILAAGAASVFRDITSFTVTNGSATATTFTLGDGTFTAIYNLPGGGGITIPFSPPLKATTAATAWTGTCGTSVASVYVVVVAVENL